MTGERRDLQQEVVWELAGGGAEAHDGGGIMWVPWRDGWMGHGQPGSMAPKGLTKGQRDWPKEQRGWAHSASLVFLPIFSKENVKLQKGLGKIIHTEKDGVIYLT